MRPPIKTREVALIALPTLFIFGYALYLRSVEAVSAPTSEKMFISSVNFAPSTSRDVYNGRSHKLTVTLSHPWPYPKWWRQGVEWNEEVDAFDPKVKNPKRKMMRGMASLTLLPVASGGAITWMENNQRQRLITKKYEMMGYGQWKDGNIVFTHNLPLQKVPANAGELTFHGVYFVGKSIHPVRLTKIIRKAGEQLQFNHSRYTGGKIEFVRVSDFERLTPINVPHEDQCAVTVRVSHRPVSEENRPSIFESELKLVDSKGRILKFDQRNLTIVTPGTFENNNTPTATERRWLVNIKRTYPTNEPLTLKGNIVVDDNWPMPFSIRLPKR